MRPSQALTKTRQTSCRSSLLLGCALNKYDVGRKLTRFSQADDDGSGTTTSVTAFASLVNASFVPSTHPVEFHFYSAEEGGLRESSSCFSRGVETDALGDSRIAGRRAGLRSQGQDCARDAPDGHDCLVRPSLLSPSLPLIPCLAGSRLALSLRLESSPTLSMRNSRSTSSRWSRSTVSRVLRALWDAELILFDLQLRSAGRRPSADTLALIMSVPSPCPSRSAR